MNRFGVILNHLILLLGTLTLHWNYALALFRGESALQGFLLHNTSDFIVVFVAKQALSAACLIFFLYGIGNLIMKLLGTGGPLAHGTRGFLLAHLKKTLPLYWVADNQVIYKILSFLIFKEVFIILIMVYGLSLASCLWECSCYLSWWGEGVVDWSFRNQSCTRVSVIMTEEKLIFQVKTGFTINFG